MARLAPHQRDLESAVSDHMDHVAIGSPSRSDHFERVHRLFEAAVELPAPEQRAFLDANAEPHVADEVMELLDALARASAFDEPPTLVVENAARAESTETPGRVGPYELVRCVGVGGMGAVYEAMRADDSYRKRVAVKLLRRGAESDLALQRFRYERQILAGLDHPNVAALLDGGVTDDGQPYFVMEFVDGQPLTAYCDVATLGVRDRLALFATVCEAVQYAHRALIVHRDLKPGNVLVADGVPKLLDFGIARLLREGEGIDQLPRTHGGVRLLTPEYASPEQFRGLPVSTASDVYALGVILFELLTGRRPFRLDGLLFGEMERIVCESTPPAPSTLVNEDAARHRGVSTSTLRDAVRGDLDAIVLRALAKDPAERYPSVEAMRADVLRHLAGDPVLARQGQRWYAVRRRLWRHRVAVGTGAAITLALAAGAGVSLNQARVAKVQASRAASINSFLRTMLGAADPGSLGPGATVRTLLDSAAVHADTLSREPVVEAEVRRVIAHTYLALGVYDQAQRQTERAIALHTAQSPGGSVELALRLGDLSLLRENVGDLVVADSINANAIAMLERVGGASHESMPVLLDNAARLAQKRGDLAAAESQHRRVIALRQRLQGAAGRDLIFSYNNLGVVLGQQGRFAEAESLHRRAAAIGLRDFGATHPEYLSSLNSLAGVLDIRGDSTEPDSLYRAVLEARRRTLGETHPDYAWTLFQYAQFLLAQRRWNEAARTARAVLALRGRSVPDGHPAIGTALLALGQAEDQLGDARSARQHLDEAIALRRATLGNDHWLVWSGESALGEHEARQGQFASAERRLLAAHAALERIRGAGSPQLRDTRRRLAALYRASGRAEQAAGWD